MGELAIECLLDREADTVTVILHDIHIDNLEKVLRDIGTNAWRTNMLDGIRAQWVAGGPEMMMSRREFHADADEEEEP